MRAPEEAVGQLLAGPTGVGQMRHCSDGIQVDFSALAHFMMTLRMLAAELGHRNGTLTGGLADPDLANAFGHAERDWSNQRRRLGAFLDGAADSVEAALTGYRELEAGLARAAAVPPPR